MVIYSFWSHPGSKCAAGAPVTPGHENTKVCLARPWHSLQGALDWDLCCAAGFTNLEPFLYSFVLHCVIINAKILQTCKRSRQYCNLGSQWIICVWRERKRWREGREERTGVGECQRQRRRDMHWEGDGDREIRELGTEEQQTIDEFPREKEGHGEITEQKEKTEMTFLKGLLCGICRKKNEMWGPERDGRRERAWGEWNE